jgi:hypothetical protein
MKRKKRLPIFLLIIIFFILWTLWGNFTVGVTNYSVESSRIPESFDKF